jgi:ethanolamine utilization protein EutA
VTDHLAGSESRARSNSVASQRDGRAAHDHHGHGQGEDDISSDIELRTIGVDIGSTTSMFTVSDVRLTLVGSRFLPVHRELVLESDIALTPYSDSGLIDGVALVRFFNEQLARGKVRVDDIDSGAVILTGNALERENSRLVGDVFADLAGKFVVTSAGDDLEAMLSAFGSGAVAASRGRSDPIVHVDIGGGTTKFAVCDDGKVTATSAIRAGARIVAFDPGGRLVHATPTGLQVLDRLGLDPTVGTVVGPDVRGRLATYVVDRVLEVLLGSESSELGRVSLTDRLALPGAFGVSFGGGVSEYIYEREERSFGDLGTEIGRLLRQRLSATPWHVVPLPRGIRSTVTGASQYTVQVTSQTVDVSSAAALPLRNVPIVVLDVGTLGESVDPALVTARLRPWVDASGTAASTVGVGLLWSGSATFQRLDAIARGVAAAMQPAWLRQRLAVVVTDADIGGLVGGAVRRHLPPEVALISVDGIECRQFDHVDIGARDASARVFPVVVKSLLFPPSRDRPEEPAPLPTLLRHRPPIASAARRSDQGAEILQED